MLIEVWLGILVIVTCIVVIIDWITILIILDRLVEEDMLRIPISSWEAIKDVSSVTAIILCKFQLNQSSCLGGVVITRFFDDLLTDIKNFSHMQNETPLGKFPLSFSLINLAV